MKVKYQPKELKAVIREMQTYESRSSKIMLSAYFQLVDTLEEVFEVFDGDYGHGISNGYWGDYKRIHEQAQQALAECAVCREGLDNGK